MKVRVACASAVFGLLVALAGCSGANYNVVAPALTPSPAATQTPGIPASPAPQACGGAVAGSVLIAVGSYIEPQIPSDTTYGTLSGYALTDAAGNYPLVARPIVLKPNDVVQFVNVDPALAGGAAGTPHSAAGLQATFFPVSHTFAASASVPTGTTIDNSSAWSTGEIPALASSLCYSQRLQLPASGVFYFGDVLFYTPANMRDVIVISPTAAS